MHVRLRRARAAVLGASIALVVAACTQTSSPIPQQSPPQAVSDGAAFYQPPAPLPAGDHGDVIWYTPTETKVFIFGTPLPAKAWKIMYRSTDSHGQPIAVTGTVMVSTRPFNGKRPVVSYPGGTKGIGDQCASSKTIPTGGEQETALFAGAIERGWAVVMADYEGLGTPGTHTYQAHISEGQVTLDAVRASLRVPGSGLAADAPVGLWGYSQGGSATIKAAELWRSYAPELNIKGVASGGVPTDLRLTASYGDGGPGFGFVAAAAVGIDAAYPELDLERYLNDRGRTEIERIKQMCTDEAINTYAGARMADFVTENPVDRPDWAARLDENKLGKVDPGGLPVFLYHGTADLFVPPAGAQALRAAYCSRGVSVQWKQYDGLDHIPTALFASGDATNWLADRFAGRAPAGNC